MAERGIDLETTHAYCDLRRYGTVPHAGFGLGSERTLAYLTGFPTCSTRSSPLYRGLCAPGKARHEPDQIAAIMQPLVIDWPIAGRIGRALD